MFCSPSRLLEVGKGGIGGSVQCQEGWMGEYLHGTRQGRDEKRLAIAKSGVATERRLEK